MNMNTMNMNMNMNMKINMNMNMNMKMNNQSCRQIGIKSECVILPAHFFHFPDLNVDFSYLGYNKLEPILTL